MTDTQLRLAGYAFNPPQTRKLHDRREEEMPLATSFMLLRTLIYGVDWRTIVNVTQTVSAEHLQHIAHILLRSMRRS